MNNINWGYVGGWAGAILSLLSSIGYAFSRDWRHALYFWFAFCITLCIIWK